MKRIDLNLYMVLWADACHNFEPDPDNSKLANAADFGFILHQEPGHLVVATELFPSGYTRHSMSIPAGTVKDIIRVATVKLPPEFESPPRFIK